MGRGGVEWRRANTIGWLLRTHSRMAEEAFRWRLEMQAESETTDLGRLMEENKELRDKLKRARWAATIWQKMASELAWKLDEITQEDKPGHDA